MNIGSLSVQNVLDHEVVVVMGTVLLLSLWTSGICEGCVRACVRVCGAVVDVHRLDDT